jgi:hypothetical protein
MITDAQRRALTSLEQAEVDIAELKLRLFAEVADRRLGGADQGRQSATEIATDRELYATNTADIVFSNGNRVGIAMMVGIPPSDPDVLSACERMLLYRWVGNGDDGGQCIPLTAEELAELANLALDRWERFKTLAPVIAARTASHARSW